MSKLSRTKGHAFERWVAQQLRSVFPDAKRQLEYQADEANGVDLANTGDYLVQCKRFKRYAPITCIDEIRPQAGKTPVLVTKPDRGEPMAVLPLSAFIRLLEAEDLAQWF